MSEPRLRHQGEAMGPLDYASTPTPDPLLWVAAAFVWAASGATAIAAGAGAIAIALAGEAGVAATLALVAAAAVALAAAEFAAVVRRSRSAATLVGWAAVPCGSLSLFALPIALILLERRGLLRAGGATLGVASGVGLAAIATLVGIAHARWSGRLRRAGGDA